MAEINWTRLFIAGLIAAVICFLSDGFLHERLVVTEWEALFANLRIPIPAEEHKSALLYFAFFELGRGFIAIFLYVLLRPLLRPGPKTAALAGIIAWLAFSVTGPAQFIPLGFYSHGLWLKVGAFHFVTSIVATIAGAAIYKQR